MSGSPSKSNFIKRLFGVKSNVIVSLDMLLDANNNNDDLDDKYKTDMESIIKEVIMLFNSKEEKTFQKTVPKMPKNVSKNMIKLVQIIARDDLLKSKSFSIFFKGKSWITKKSQRQLKSNELVRAAVEFYKLYLEPFEELDFSDCADCLKELRTMIRAGSVKEMILIVLPLIKSLLTSTQAKILFDLYIESFSNTSDDTSFDKKNSAKSALSISDLIYTSSDSIDSSVSDKSIADSITVDTIESLEEILSKVMTLFEADTKKTFLKQVFKLLRKLLEEKHVVIVTEIINVVIKSKIWKSTTICYCLFVIPALFAVIILLPLLFKASRGMFLKQLGVRLPDIMAIKIDNQVLFKILADLANNRIGCLLWKFLTTIMINLNESVLESKKLKAFLKSLQKLIKHKSGDALRIAFKSLMADHAIHFKKTNQTSCSDSGCNDEALNKVYRNKIVTSLHVFWKLSGQFEMEMETRVVNFMVVSALFFNALYEQ